MASETQRFAWKLAGGAVALAFAFLLVREGPATVERTSARRIALHERDTLVRLMSNLLERDPRVRRKATQQVVSVVAGLADNPVVENAEVYYAAGLRAFYGADDLPLAEREFRKACELRPDWAKPYNNLGIVLFAGGNEVGAMEAFRRAMELEPEWSRPHSDLAILYRLSGRMDEALAEVRRALELDPDGAVTHYNYAVLLDVLEQRDAAREQYEIVVDLDPSLPAPYYNLACHFARRGDLTRALPYLVKAIRLDEAFIEEAKRDPDFDSVRNEGAFQAALRAVPQD